jgi:hypothetical protein
MMGRYALKPIFTSRHSKACHFHSSDENGTETVNEIRVGDLKPAWLQNFKRNASLKVLCHGYKSSPEKPFPADMKACKGAKFLSSSITC